MQVLDEKYGREIRAHVYELGFNAMQLLRVQRHVDDLLCVGIMYFDSTQHLSEG